MRALPDPAFTSGDGIRLPLIDVHNHIFNGSDLPTVRFLKIVVAKNYPRQALKALEIDHPDTLDDLIDILTRILGRTRAPVARDEIRVLDKQMPPVGRNAQIAANESAVISVVAEYLDHGPIATGTDMRRSRTIRSAILKAAGESAMATSDAKVEPAQARHVAEKAYRSKFDLGLLLRWFALFTRYRYVLAEQLAKDHASQQFDARLLCPALTDFDSWLGERVEDSPLPDQVDVMGRLARRREGPVVHGYVAYDPLRQALYEGGFFGKFNPLQLVRRAIREEGFVGVKIYPPMGFKPFGNSADPCQSYPDIVAIQALMRGASSDLRTAGCSPRPDYGATIVSEKLDKAMTSLFDLCVQEDAAVIAHANDSNGASEGVSSRADPAYWIGAFRCWPTLRVGLAHFGHFTARSAAALPGTILPEASWEWTFGRYIQEAADPPVFADISYLNEIYQRSPEELRAYSAKFRLWIATFDPECRHLMFGTDWTMLGLDPSYDGYTARVYAFFKNTCLFSPSMMDRLFVGNAARFLGMREGDGARKRLLAFYDRHGVARTRLPVFA